MLVYGQMKMKFMRASCVIALVLSFSVVSALAIPTPVNVTMSGGVNVVAAPKSDLGNFGDGTVFNWLSNSITAYNDLNGTSYPEPTANLDGTPLAKVETGSGPRSVNLTLGQYDYVFLHWGGQGGGWAQAYYIGDVDGTVTFAAPPGNPPLIGGLSFYSFYGQGVPDGGNTLVLIGIACLALVPFVRKTKTA